MNYFDEHFKPDVDEILDVAALLDITEFRVFKIAYGRWFGRRADNRTIEPYFAAYMFREIVPHWVRQFTRFVIESDHAGSLDSRSLGIYRLQASEQMISKGKRFTAALLLIFGTLLVLAISADHLLEITRNCFFPPCY